MLPHYIARYHGQDLGFKGPNLVNKWHKEIHLQTAEMNPRCIHNVSGDCFYVELTMDSIWRYLVNLGNKSCFCPDWPRVWLCKHVSAVEHYFGNNCQQMGVAEDVLPKMPLLQFCKMWSWYLDAPWTLDDSVPSSTEAVWSLQVIEAHFTAVVCSTCSTESPVPETEEIPSNQCCSMWVVSCILLTVSSPWQDFGMWHACKDTVDSMGLG